MGCDSANSLLRARPEAKGLDQDNVFWCDAIDQGSFKKLNILVFYNPLYCHTVNVKEHVQSFSKYSVHNYHYAICIKDQQISFDLAQFDVIVIHYSIRLTMDLDSSIYISNAYVNAIKAFTGYVVAFAQDEYESTGVFKKSVNELGIDLLVSCVPPNYIERVYPKSAHPDMEVLSTLTGFVPYALDVSKFSKPMAERKINIGYRGRPLLYHYGDLGWEKLEIGQSVKAYCQQMKELYPVDIEWDEDLRIYGNDWYHFIAGCRCTLGTESGSNIFDWKGELKPLALKEAIKPNPMTYQAFKEKYLQHLEDDIKMNQISPKLFEAASLRVAMILYEGEYSGVLESGKHYIALKKDLSNIDEVIALTKDTGYLEAMVDRVYTDIILSEQYAYRRFVLEMDAVLARRVKKPKECMIRSVNIDLQLVRGAFRSGCGTVLDLYGLPQKWPDVLDIAGDYQLRSHAEVRMGYGFLKTWQYRIRRMIRSAFICLMRFVYVVARRFVPREKLMALYNTFMQKHVRLRKLKQYI